MGYFQDTGVLLLYGMTALLWIKADRSFIHSNALHRCSFMWGIFF